MGVTDRLSLGTQAPLLPRWRAGAGPGGRAAFMEKGVPGRRLQGVRDRTQRV